MMVGLGRRKIILSLIAKWCAYWRIWCCIAWEVLSWSGKVFNLDSLCIRKIEESLEWSKVQVVIMLGGGRVSIPSYQSKLGLSPITTARWSTIDRDKPVCTKGNTYARRRAEKPLPQPIPHKRIHFWYDLTGGVIGVFLHRDCKCRLHYKWFSI